MQRCLAIALLLALPAFAEPWSIDLGSDTAEPSLGFGWSHGESGTNRTFRWMDRLEADIWFESDGGSEVELALNAAPMYLAWKRQVIGVYVNGRFIAEWRCPDDPEFHDYSVTLPAGTLKPGRNRLTLRLGYHRRVPPDTREVGLAVHRISITPR